MWREGGPSGGSGPGGWHRWQQTLPPNSMLPPEPCSPAWASSHPTPNLPLNCSHSQSTCSGKASGAHGPALVASKHMVAVWLFFQGSRFYSGGSQDQDQVISVHSSALSILRAHLEVYQYLLFPSQLCYCKAVVYSSNAMRATLISYAESFLTFHYSPLLI